MSRRALLAIRLEASSLCSVAKETNNISTIRATDLPLQSNKTALSPSSYRKPLLLHSFCLLLPLPLILFRCFYFSSFNIGLTKWTFRVQLRLSLADFCERFFCQNKNYSIINCTLIKYRNENRKEITRFTIAWWHRYSSKNNRLHSTLKTLKNSSLTSSIVYLVRIHNMQWDKQRRFSNLVLPLFLALGQSGFVTDTINWRIRQDSVRCRVA